EPALDALALAVVEARALRDRVPEPLEGGSAALEMMGRVLVEGAQRLGAIPGTAAAQREDPAREVGRQAPRELGEGIHHPARDLVGVDQRRAAPLDAEIVERHRGGNRERLLRPQRSAQGVAQRLLAQRRIAEATEAREVERALVRNLGGLEEPAIVVE